MSFFSNGSAKSENSMASTECPHSRNAFVIARPDNNDTSCSADGPPMSTATRTALAGIHMEFLISTYFILSLILIRLINNGTSFVISPAPITINTSLSWRESTILFAESWKDLSKYTAGMCLISWTIRLGLQKFSSSSHALNGGRMNTKSAEKVHSQTEPYSGEHVHIDAVEKR